MDYKSKFKDLSNWRERMGTQIMPCPFNASMPGAFEFIAPDGVSVFLAFYASELGPNNITTYYLAEAPRDCPMRLAMECGDIDLYDYWYSRPWLIQLNKSLFDDSYFAAAYITPREIDLETHHLLKNCTNPSPLDQKLQLLIEEIEREGKRKPGKLPWLQKDLADFKKIYEAKKRKAA